MIGIGDKGNLESCRGELRNRGRHCRSACLRVLDKPGPGRQKVAINKENAREGDTSLFSGETIEK